jgi:hypothetical protein
MERFFFIRAAKFSNNLLQVTRNEGFFGFNRGFAEAFEPGEL